MNVQNKSIYEFGSFRLDSTQHVLLREGQIVPLTPKVFETLRVLVENGGQVVDKDDLLQKIWSDTIVEETSLAKNISVLRKILNDNGWETPCIETIPKRGYRFTAPVKEVEVSIPGKVDIADEAPADTDLFEVDTESNNYKSTSSIKSKAGFIVAVAVFLSLITLIIFWLAKSESSYAKTSSDIKTIAILPFKPLNNNEEDKYLGLGMADALIVKLGQLDKVSVSPTSSIKPFTHPQDINAIEVGKTLKVGAVLESTLQRTPERIRVTVQLINVADGRQIWSDKFDEKTTDFFLLQDAIAMRVANSLISQLTEAEREKLARRGTNNPEALRFLVLGENWIDQETTEGFNKAVEYFNKAIELDPNYTPAYSALSYAYYDSSESILVPGEAMPKAKMYAERAQQMDNTQAFTYHQLAWIKMLYDWDWEGSENGFKRALELDKNSGRAYFGYATFLALMGRKEESLAALEQAKNINPISVIGSNVLYRVGEYDRSMEEAKKALELNPRRISSLQWLAMGYEKKGEYQKAVETFEKARQIEDTPELKAFQAHTYALSGDREAALKTINELKAIKERYVSPFYFAVIYAGLGDKEQTLECLEKAYRDKSWWIATLKANPYFDDLRDDVRFQALLRRVKL